MKRTCYGDGMSRDIVVSVKFEMGGIGQRGVFWMELLLPICRDIGARLLLLLLLLPA